MFHNLKSQRTLDNSTLELDITVVNKNLLYVTHRVDAIFKEIHSLRTDLGLQRQATEYLDRETSPQTDSEEQIGPNGD